MCQKPGPHLTKNHIIIGGYNEFFGPFWATARFYSIPEKETITVGQNRFMLRALMCGRFTQTDGVLDLLRALGVEIDQRKFEPHYNVAPSQPIWSVRGQAPGNLEAVQLFWGLVPSWVRDPSSHKKMINARSETIFEKVSFKKAIRSRRCLVPCTGFYEWRRLDSKSKQPYLISTPRRQAFWIAGIWERWESGDQVIESVAILTEAASPSMAHIHDRMPVLVPNEKAPLWLQAGAEFEAWLKNHGASEWTFYPVATAVNSPGYDAPDCMQEVAILV